MQLLRQSHHDVLVVGGYGVFAAQAAIAWSRLTRRAYVVHSESHFGKARQGWKRTVKGAILPQVIGRAAAGLAAGTAAAEYLQAYGLPRERIRIFPNTIDVAAYRERAAEARARADELGLPERYALYVGRLSPEKGVEDLAAAIRLAGDAAPPVVVAGDGPLADALPSSVKRLGFVQPSHLPALYARAERVVVPSRFETWGVVVNEALACGTPVVATSAVGAAADLIVDGVNGIVVPPRDPVALAAALTAPAPAGDPAAGRLDEWDYDFAVAQFVEAMELSA